MHFFAEGAWKESREEIEITPTGAAATRLPFKVHFPVDILDGAIEVTMPDHQRLRSRPVGVGYASADTGKSVMVGLLKSSVGVLVASNRLIYPNCLRGDVRGDLVCTVSKAGIESDIVIREQPASWPSDYGMAANENVRLQVFTEFFEAPTPQKSTAPLYRRDRLTDETIDFGGIQIVRGKAWKLGDEDADGGIFVSKQWVELEDRRFLVEQVPFRLAAEKLQALPRRTAALEPRSKDPVLRRVSAKRLLPKLEMAGRSKERITLASLPARESGYVLDAMLVTSQPNFRFAGDTTYVVMGAVNLSGTTVIEGGTVVKFWPGTTPKITCTGPVDCQTGPYRPAVFTSRDDVSIGEDISMSALTGYYGNGLTINTSGSSLKYLRFRYANSALRLGFSSGQIDLANFQVLDSLYGVDFNGNSEDIVNVDNSLFYSITNVTKSGYDNYLNGRHVTVDHCLKMFAIGNGNHNGEVHFDNCILADVTHRGNADVYDGNNNGFYLFPYTSFGANPVTTTTSPFQTSGGGKHYLPAGSSFKAAGTTSIPTTLLDSLKTKTTYAPIDFPLFFVLTGELTLFPQIARYASGAPDLGYHYDAVDYTVAAMLVQGGTVKLLPGTVLGYRQEIVNEPWWPFLGYSEVGINILKGSSLVAQGTPERPITFADVQMVQEQTAIGLWYPIVVDRLWVADPGDPSEPPPVLDFRFSNFYISTEACHLGCGDGFTWSSALNLTLRDCNMFNGYFWLGKDGAVGINPPCSLVIQNSLFDRVKFHIDPDSVDQGDPQIYVDLAVDVRNSLFRHGGLEMLPIPRTPAWSFKDNLFDKEEFMQGSAQSIEHDHNGYWPLLTSELQWGGTTALSPAQANGVTLTAAPAYQTGPFGNYYLGGDSETSRLLNAGSRPAAEAGLFHYTSLANQTKDGNQAHVNIGLHYVATASSGATTAKDSDGDGIPDYVENWHGDGDTGANRAHITDETDWQNDHTETGVADAVSPIYDDIDLDGDGMVGRIEKALNPANPQPLVQDNPFAMARVTTGNEPEIATFQLLINHANLASIGSLTLFVSGEDAPLQGFDPDQDGNCLLEWNTTYNSPGQHFAQPMFVLNDSSHDQGVLVSFGPLVPYNSENAVQFDEGFSQFDDNGAVLFAYLPSLNASYSIELKTPAGAHIKTIPINSTANGTVSEAWDLLDDAQNLFTGDEVEAVFTVTLQDQPEQTRRQKLPKATVYVPNGNFDIAFAWDYAPDVEEPNGQMWQCMQFSVVNPLMQPLGLYEVYLSTFNEFTWGFSWGDPGYLPDNTSVVSELIPDLSAPATRNFYFAGHGSEVSIGAGDAGPDGAYISPSQISQALGNPSGFWKLKYNHPYRFVFLNACSTAKTHRWRRAFGIRERVSPAAISFCGPQAFVGWCDRAAAPNFEKYSDTMEVFWVGWMLGYPLADCIDFAANRNSTSPISGKTLQQPLQTEGNEDIWGATGTAPLRVFGYPGITVDSYEVGYW